MSCTEIKKNLILKIILEFKMKPLATHERVLTWLCIFPAANDTSKWKKSLYILLVFILFVLEVCALVSSLIFFLKNVSNNLEESLYSLFQISAFSCLTYFSFISFYSRHEIMAVFGKLAQIYADGENFFDILCNFQSKLGFEKKIRNLIN